MGKMCFVIALAVLLVHTTVAKIRNGYEPERQLACSSLDILKELLTKNKYILPAERYRIETRIKDLQLFLAYADLTDALINQFRIIAPELFQEIEELQDRRRRRVDVYVRIVPQFDTDVKAAGTTYMEQSESDPDMHISRYGKLTVSVNIWLVNNVLQVLSHELGHVKFQVANLASYIQYHKKHYSINPSNYMGHHASDSSGMKAMEFERRFALHYRKYVKMNGRPTSPILLLSRISRDRRSWKDEQAVSLTSYR